MEIDKIHSKQNSVVMEFRQGSTLAPLRFIIFPLPQKVIIYADDISQPVTVSQLAASVPRANNSTDEFPLWCKNNDLIIKTRCLCYEQKNI